MHNIITDRSKINQIQQMNGIFCRFIKKSGNVAFCVKMVITLL